MANGLSPMQQAFCREYIVDLCGRQAAIRAGASPRSAEVMASRWLSKVKVQRRIADLLRPKLRSLDRQADDVIRRLATLGFARLDQFCNWDGKTLTVRPFEEIPEELRAGISKIKVTETSKDGQDYTTRTVEVAMETRHPHLKTLAEYFKLIGGAQVQDNRVQIVIAGDGIISGRPDGTLMQVEQVEIAERDISTTLDSASGRGVDGSA